MNNLYGYAMLIFHLTSGFKWINPKEFDLNEYTRNSSKECVLEVYREHPIQLSELHNDYPLTPDKIEIKREMLSDYKFKLADFYNIPSGNIKKLVVNIFDKDKYGLQFENLQNFLKLGLRIKNTLCIRVESITMAKNTY